MHKKYFMQTHKFLAMHLMNRYSTMTEEKVAWNLQVYLAEMLRIPISHLCSKRIFDGKCELMHSFIYILAVYTFCLPNQNSSVIVLHVHYLTIQFCAMCTVHRIDTYAPIAQCHII